MSVYSRSRYSGALVTEVILADGERRPYIHDRKVRDQSAVGPDSDSLTFNPGLSLDLIALRNFSAEVYWWVVADVNGILFPEVDESLVDGPSTLFFGKQLLLPNPRVI